MGIACFATLGLLAGNANDPAMRIVRQAIIFSQAGYGLIFMTYVVSNFILMMARNIGVYKVLYQPNRMPYFTYRFMGTIAMLTFVFASDWREYVDNGRAGFYNFTAGLYALRGESTYSQAFYEQAQRNGFANNQANYAMGTIHASQLEFNKAKEDYRSATVRFPSKYALINSGNLLIWENQPFKAIQAYREALQRTSPYFRTDPEITLAFAYRKSKILIRPFVYLNDARADNDLEVLGRD